MSHLLLVALGGALGSVARYKLGEWVLLSHPGWTFPLGTFVVNVLGCLVIGVLAGIINVRPGVLCPEAQLLLFTGLLGGFTTFSAFGLETFNLLRRGEVFTAGSYVGLSLLAGTLAVCLGFVVAAGVSRGG